jgi:fluoride ion exporter CrcB/FEX
MITLPMWATLILVAVAGGLGALIRHAVTVVGFPNAVRVRRRITAVNVGGAFFSGALLATDSVLAVAIAVGLFGALTTFSTIAVWVAEDLQQKHGSQAIRLVTTHVLFGVLAVIAGFLAAGFIL